MKIATIIGLTFVGLVLVAGLSTYWLLLTSTDRQLLQAPVTSLTIKNTERTYRLFNAESTSSQPRPLVVGFHGLKDRALWIGAYSGLHQLALEEDFVLALPSGINQSWNGTFCCGWAFRNQPDDIAFVEAMIEDIAQSGNIDQRRIFAVGFSNGGVMAQKVLHELPGTFAGAASVMSGVADEDGGQLDISEANPKRLLLINGTRDQYVPVKKPIQNPEQYQFIPARDTAERWATQLDLELSGTAKTENYTAYTYGNGQLEQRIYDEAHRWPEWRLWTLPDTIPESTRQMWDYLADQRPI